jgi:hypothetical protein
MTFLFMEVSSLCPWFKSDEEMIAREAGEWNNGIVE